MNARIATVPGTPLLIPDIAAGATADLAGVRRAALGRVAWAGGASAEIVVLAQDPAAEAVRRLPLGDTIDLGPLGLAARIAASRNRESGQPVSAIVAAWLAAEAGVAISSAWAVPSDPSLVDLPVEVAQASGVVVVADGSSTRTPKAPGAFVDGSVEFDEALTTAVAAVDAGFFEDPRRGEDADAFGVQGLGAWAAAARLTAGPAGDRSGDWAGEVDIATDPFGVCYIVAGWSSSP